METAPKVMSANDIPGATRADREAFKAEHNVVTPDWRGKVREGAVARAAEASGSTLSAPPVATMTDAEWKAYQDRYAPPAPVAPPQVVFSDLTAETCKDVRDEHPVPYVVIEVLDNGKAKLGRLAPDGEVAWEVHGVKVEHLAPWSDKDTRAFLARAAANHARLKRAANDAANAAFEYRRTLAG